MKLQFRIRERSHSWDRSILKPLAAFLNVFPISEARAFTFDRGLISKSVAPTLSVTDNSNARAITIE